MPLQERNTHSLEVWADSFHEGEWFADLLVRFALVKIRSTVSYQYNFLPVYKFEYPDLGKTLVMSVFGNYNSWSSIPHMVQDVIAFERPDAILVDVTLQKPLLILEETAAVPTGNQALQRAGRPWWAAQLGIPFIYLVPEVGTHTTDENPRTISSWIPYQQLKLSWLYRVPSLTLFFGDAAHPEDYEAGNGVKFLGQYLNLIVLKNLDVDVSHKLRSLYFEIFKYMGVFLEKHKQEIVENLPGVEYVGKKEFIDLLITKVM